MRRLLLVLAVLTLSAAACADDADTEVDEQAPSTTSGTGAATLPSVSSTVVTPTVPTSTTAGTSWPTPVGADALPPRLLVADGVEITSLQVRADGSIDRTSVYVADHPVTDLHQSSQGYLFTREVEQIVGDEPAVEFVRYHPDAGREVLEVEGIFDVAVVNGIESVIVAVPSPDGYGFGGVEAWAVDDLRVVTDLGLEAEAEFGVTSFDWSEAAELGVATAWSDLTEWIGFVDSDGESAERPSPTDDLEYNSPPYVTAAAIADDGRSVYWAEGPDWGFDPETEESGPVAAPWELHGAELDTGESTLNWPLSEPVLDSTVLDVHSIVPLGDFIIVNRTTLRGTETVALAPLVLDRTGEEPHLYELPIVGIATAWAV